VLGEQNGARKKKSDSTGSMKSENAKTYKKREKDSAAKGILLVGKVDQARKREGKRGPGTERGKGGIGLSRARQKSVQTKMESTLGGEERKNLKGSPKSKTSRVDEGENQVGKKHSRQTINRNGAKR